MKKPVFGQFFVLFFITSAQNLTYEIIRPFHPPNKDCPFIGWFARHSSVPQRFVSVGPFVTWRQETRTEPNAISYNNCNDTWRQRWSTANEQHAGVSVRSLTPNKSVAVKQGVCVCVFVGPPRLPTSELSFAHGCPPQSFAPAINFAPQNPREREICFEIFVCVSTVAFVLDELCKSSRWRGSDTHTGMKFLYTLWFIFVFFFMVISRVLCFISRQLKTHYIKYMV